MFKTHVAHLWVKPGRVWACYTCKQLLTTRQQPLTQRVAFEILRVLVYVVYRLHISKLNMSPVGCVTNVTAVHAVLTAVHAFCNI